MPLTPEQLKYFKDKLLEQKERIINDLQHLQGAALNESHRDSTGDLSGYSLHIADQGTDNFDREFTFDLVANEQEILYEIDAALERIQSDQYNECESCSKEIGFHRLDALPFARLCIECKTKEERRRKR